MLIRLRVDETNPPCGEVGADGEEAFGFSGWLDLMRVLSELIEGRDAAPRTRAD